MGANDMVSTMDSTMVVKINTMVLNMVRVMGRSVRANRLEN